jgi:hypothetical protein
VLIHGERRRIYRKFLLVDLNWPTQENSLWFFGKSAEHPKNEKQVAGSRRTTAGEIIEGQRK